LGCWTVAEWWSPGSTRRHSQGSAENTKPRVRDCPTGCRLFRRCTPACWRRVVYWQRSIDRCGAAMKRLVIGRRQRFRTSSAIPLQGAPI
jgi:hypothetical protein